MYHPSNASIRDVVRALKQRKLRVALRISQQPGQQRRERGALSAAALRPQRVGTRVAACGGRHDRAASFWIVRVITGVAGLGLQLAGPLRGRRHLRRLGHGRRSTRVGALAVLLQHVVVWRVTSCSPGE